MIAFKIFQKIFLIVS